MNIKGAIFDLDGTLLDSMSIWDTLGEEYLISLGIQPQENLGETFQNMSLTQSAEYYRTEYGVDKTVEEIISEINAMIEQFYISEVCLKKGVKTFLQELAENDVKMCVATSIDAYLAEAALTRNGVRQYFGEIFTCNVVGSGKDNPLIYETALQYLKTKKKETLVFEDAVFALETAQKAGFITVGVYDKSEENQDKVRKVSDFYIKYFVFDEKTKQF